MAHEINTPLSALQLNLYLLKKNIFCEEPDSEKSEQFIGKIDMMIHRIARIIYSLQTFSRDADLDPMTLAPVKNIISDTLELCQERFRNLQIPLYIEGLEGELSIICRPVQIEQVLLNLLNNALQAVSQLSEKWVRVKIYSDNKILKVSVTDSGRGILPDFHEKIFQPFFTTIEAGKGTGLGLSVSRGIVERHGGRIYIEPSCPNTQIVVELPHKQT